METTIIRCSRCGSKMRIPSGKHIRFDCPACGKSFRALNGTLHEGNENTSDSEANRYFWAYLHFVICNN